MQISLIGCWNINCESSINLYIIGNVVNYLLQIAKKILNLVKQSRISSNDRGKNRHFVRRFRFCRTIEKLIANFKKRLLENITNFRKRYQNKIADLCKELRAKRELWQTIVGKVVNLGKRSRKKLWISSSCCKKLYFGKLFRKKLWISSSCCKKLYFGKRSQKKNL